ncbi:MAG: LacI family DNA-binding transcriptional regulator [Planctomycetota bacterium]
MRSVYNTPVKKKRRSTRFSTASVISDVADRAGVSTATVSRVINSPELVADATAERVRRAMDELDYRPNLFAKGLITRSTGVLGVILPDFHGEFYGALLQAADAEARRAGYNLIVASDARPDSADAAQSLPVHFLDGVIAFVPFPNDALVRSIGDLSISAVLIDAQQELEGADRISIDNTSGATAAVRHLVERTDADDCFHVGGPETNYDSIDRAEAFRAVLRERGASGIDDRVASGEFSIDWGYRWALDTLTTRTGRPTAVFAGNDDIAVGVLNAARQLGVACPDRLRIVGFDGSRVSAASSPKLSTVQVPLAEIGTKAVQMCVRHIADPTINPSHAVVPTRLAVHDSS